MIYSVAESGGELEDLLNPEFPPEQMQLIADVQNRTDAISRAAAEEAMEPLIQQPMTPAEVNHARRQHNLPLDSEAETEQPVQPKQEPMNFRITDDDLGAGGPKTKYKANVEAIRVLQTLDAEQRQTTAKEQEILSGMWDGAAFRRRSMKAMRSGRKSMPNYSPCSRQMSIRKPAPVP